MSPNELTRRKALTLLAAGAGAAIVGACRSNDGPARTSADGGPTTSGAGAGGGSAAGEGSGPGSTSPSTSPPPAAAPTLLTAADFGPAATCRVTPQQTAGPYYIDVDTLRRDIREDRPGTPLRVAARVVDGDGCTPLRDAVFEIWHCDAGGLYSGFESASRGGSGRDGSRYLRGAQVTNADGIAELLTVYPGWYGGRTVHIHAKVQLNSRDALTTQLYFDDAVTDEVYRVAPYTSRPNRDRRNDNDGIFQQGTVMTTRKDGEGYLALITIGVQA